MHVRPATVGTLPRSCDPGKALITGGAGFIGSHLAELLLDGRLGGMGARRPLDGLARQRRAPARPAPVPSRRRLRPLANGRQRARATRSTSSTTSPRRSAPRLIVERPVHTIVTNLEGSEIVLDHCARFGRRVLVASTSEVYGDHRSQRAARRGRPPRLRADDAAHGGCTPTRRRWTSTSRSRTARSETWTS